MAQFRLQRFVIVLLPAAFLLVAAQAFGQNPVKHSPVKWTGTLDYDPQPAPTRLLRLAADGNPELVKIRVLAERCVLGSSEIEVAEVTQQPYRQPEHVPYHFHASHELWYVLEGTLRHEFKNPRATYHYKPGQVAIVRAGDHVKHIAETPLRAVVVWAPGGEVNRLAQSPLWTETILSEYCEPTEKVLGPASKTGATVSRRRSGALNILKYDRQPTPTRNVGLPNAVNFKIWVDRSNLGSSEVEIAEVIQRPFPGQEKQPFHFHASMEIFYIIEGTLKNVFQDPDEHYIYGPGDLAIIRPGDQVKHLVTSEEPVKGVIIWATGGESERLGSFPGWYDVPIPSRPGGH
jgi:quercetin dioxygenase-like cupin family protein